MKRTRTPKLQRGAALIELALTIPFLILLSWIVIQFGQALYEYNTVTKSVRDGVRYFSMQAVPVPTPTTDTCPTAVTYLVRYGQTTQGSTPLARGLNSDAMVKCTWQSTGASPLIVTATVTVTGYRFLFMLGSVFGTRLDDGQGGLTFSNISASMRAPS